MEKPSVYHMLPHESPVLPHVTPWVEYVFGQFFDENCLFLESLR